MCLNDKVYDLLKWVGRYLLPSLATLVIGIGEIWHVPYTAEIGATICALDGCLNGLLGISSANYNAQ